MVRTESTFLEPEKSVQQEDVLRLKETFDSTNMAIWTVDDSRRLLVGNKDFYHWYHLFTGEDIAVGEPVISPVIDVSTNGLWKGLYDRAFKGERFSHQMNSWIDRTNVFSVTFNPHMDQRGQVTQVTCVGFDMTAQTQLAPSAKDRLERMVMIRTQELRALYQLTSIAISSTNETSLLDRSIEMTLSALECEYGMVFLEDEERRGKMRLVAHLGLSSNLLHSIQNGPSLCFGVVDWVTSRNARMVSENIRSDPRIHARWSSPPLACVSVPLFSKNRSMGAIVCMQTAPRVFTAEECNLVETVAEQITTGLERLSLIRQAAIADERQKLARDLHDSVTQSLYSLVLFADGVDGYARQGKWTEALEYLADINQTSQAALREMRLLLFEFQSISISDKGLVNSLRLRLDAVERRAGVETTLDEHDLPANIPMAMQEALYRISQEALNNALKYAQATRVSIVLRYQDEKIRLEINDNGRGFSPDKALESGGMGLKNIRRRVEEYSGTLEISSSPGGGTKLQVIIPFL